MFSSLHAAQSIGINAEIINVETDISRGLHSFTLVGLPNKSVEESRDRVNAAIKNAGFQAPKQKNHKTVVSLAPADLKKEGPLFDLSIALGYLKASKQIRAKTDHRLFLGELSLSGELRSVKGILTMIQTAQKQGFQEVYLPKENATEAALIKGIDIYGANTLQEVIKHIDETPKDTEETGQSIKINKEPEVDPSTITRKKIGNTTDFFEVRGQENAKRALEIAAAGRHNIALYGPPGTGKTMLAQAFTSILPGLSYEEILETTGIHSVAGLLEEDLMTNAPFRAPHHTASFASLVGGGNIPRPGEITLAHRGVLFLDEFPEFDRRAVEALRQPLENKIINITRTQGSMTYPADFIFIGAMNPCPCGNSGDQNKVACTCSPSALERYQRKMSGPIMDRVDIWTEVGTVDPELFDTKNKDAETSKDIQERVINARTIQRNRFAQNTPEKTNSALSSKQTEQYAELTDDAREILQTSARKMNISARSYYRLIKTARTIADLENSKETNTNHILEALQYRPGKIFENQ